MSLEINIYVLYNKVEFSAPFIGKVKKKLIISQNLELWQVLGSPLPI